MKHFIIAAFIAILAGCAGIHESDTMAGMGKPEPTMGMDLQTACWHTTWGIADGLSYTQRADGTVIAVARWTMHGHKTMTFVNNKVVAITVY